VNTSWAEMHARDFPRRGDRGAWHASTRHRAIWKWGFVRAVETTLPWAVIPAPLGEAFALDRRGQLARRDPIAARYGAPPTPLIESVLELSSGPFIQFSKVPGYGWTMVRWGSSGPASDKAHRHCYAR